MTVEIRLSERVHIDEGRFQILLDEYYGEHGWDEHGVPRKETLERLD